MGAFRAGGLTGLMNQPSAQVIDGSLKFDSLLKHHLEKDFTSNGNRKTWTWSSWVKKSDDEGFSEDGVLFEARIDSPGSTDANIFGIRWRSNGRIGVYDTGNFYVSGTREFRDTSAFYHLVLSVDTTKASNNISLYVNGDLYSQGSYTQNSDTRVNSSAATHRIGARTTVGSQDGLFLSSQLSQTYFIDGLALGPGYFGFTDPLTNTWRPKKFRAEGTTVNDGTVWSNAVPTADGFRPGRAAADGFDGDLTTYVALNNTTFNLDVGSWGISGTMEVYTGANMRYATDGSSASNMTADSWTTVGDAGSISTLTFTRSDSNYPYFYAIRVDGVIMVDSTTTNLDFGTNGFYLPFDGNSPIGQDKSGVVTPNNGSIWSNSLTSSSGFRSSEPKTNAFDGNTSSICSAVGSGTITFTSPVTFASNSTIRVFLHGGDHTVTVNGGSNQTISAGSFQTVTYSNSGNATFTMTFHRGGGADTGVRAIEIDNHILVDGQIGNNWTPVNFGGSAGVDQATGALPILEGAGGAVANVGVRTDANASHLVLALPLIGSANDVSNQINSGSTTKAINAVGNAAASSAQSNFYGGSFVYDGSGDALKSTVSGLAPGTSDFCCEGWFYFNSLSSAVRLLGNVNTHANTTDWQLIYQSNGTLTIWNDSSYASIGTAPFTTGKWHHVAYVRDGDTHKAYVDGVQMSTTITRTGNNLTYSGLDIGGRNDGAECLSGYVQDVRFYIGTTKYTSNFIPASTSPDILPDTPSGVSGSSKLTKITDGAVNFDGTGDYLDVANVDTAFGSSSDWTLELFIYPRTVGLTAITDPRTGDSTNHPLIWIKSTGVLYYYAGGADRIVGTTVLATNKWHHVAAVRSGGTTTLYLDGKSEGSFSDSLDYASTTNFRIGQRYTGTAYNYNGFISNLRLVNGTAVYTGTRITPPAAPLTNITNTKLLICQSTSFYAAVAPLVSGVNNGTVWSSSLTADSLFRSSSYPAKDAFNGVTKTSTEDCAATPQVAGQGFTFLFGGGVPFTTLQMQCDHNNGATVTANGVNITSQLSSGSLTNTTITGVTSPLTSLSVVSHNGDAGYLGSVTIDGTMLVDPFVPNGDVATTNFNPFNTDINTVRGQETGYATLNPLNHNGGTLSNGNLKLAHSGAANVSATLQIPTTGKWYWEYFLDRQVGGGVLGIGDGSAMKGTGLGDWTKLYGYSPNGQKYEVLTGAGYGATLAAGDLVGVKYDADTRQLEFLKNGVSQGVAYTNVSSDYDYYPSIHVNNSDVTANFGQKPFKFPPPDGFQPLNAANVRPETVIARPDQYVGATIGNFDQQKTHDIGFQPDLIWHKATAQAQSHFLTDSVRGKNSYLISNNTNAAGTFPQGGQYGITSFNYNGWTQGSYGPMSEGSMVAWTWKAGGNKNTFNVDDVGYASASDVNMSVGALNNIAFNKSQAWSSNASGGGNAANAFNGVGPKRDNYSHSGSALTLTFSPALTGRIVVYGGTGAGSHNSTTTDTFTLSDGSVLSSQEKYNVFPYFTKMDFGEKSGITSLVCSAGYTLYGITLDGKLLVDSGVSINAPTIANSKCSVGTKQGFSIINFTNTTSNSTHAHGLTQKPDFIVMKKTNGTSHWPVYHSSMGPKYGYLNLTNAFGIGSGEMWNYTEPNDYYVTLKGEPNTFGSAGNVIMYCWHDVPGLQKFGSFTGNNNADGVFVELGFKPAILLLKNDNSTGDWIIWDNKRNPHNPVNRQIWPYTTSGTYGAYDQVGSNYPLDFLSNGFKMRTNDADMNGNRTYIYAAWAEAPTFNLYGAQSNAR